MREDLAGEPAAALLLRAERRAEGGGQLLERALRRPAVVRGLAGQLAGQSRWVNRHQHAREAVGKLGGDDLDAALGNVIAKRFLDKTGYDILNSPYKTQFMLAIEKAKIELSSQTSTVVRKAELVPERHLSLEEEIDRQTFEKEIMPLVDLFLWDYKATGEALHQSLTGVDGRLIRANLLALHDSGAKIRLRCPMVPGVNDSPEHLRAIAQFSAKLGNLDGVDVMPYHSFGRDKATRVGLTQSGLPGQPASQDQISAWLLQLKNFGCEKATIG